MPNSAIPIAIARSMAPPRSVMTRQHHRFRGIIPTDDSLKTRNFPRRVFPEPPRPDNGARRSRPPAQPDSPCRPSSNTTFTNFTPARRSSGSLRTRRPPAVMGCRRRTGDLLAGHGRLEQPRTRARRQPAAVPCSSAVIASTANSAAGATPPAWCATADARVRARPAVRRAPVGRWRRAVDDARRDRRAARQLPVRLPVRNDLPAGRLAHARSRADDDQSRRHAAALLRRPPFLFRVAARRTRRNHARAAAHASLRAAGRWFDQHARAGRSPLSPRQPEHRPLPLLRQRRPHRCAS